MKKSTNRNTSRYQDGYSLWELSLVIIIMVGLFVALVNIMPFLVKRENIEVDNKVLVTVDEHLLGFIASYSRLPCPDSDNDGLENCTVSTGSVPYKTLGLNEDYAGVGSIPIMYSVFRNATAMADLTNITNLFNPTDSHSTVTTINNINGLDFCTALNNAKSATFSSSLVHLVLPNGTTSAVPYVIVTAGTKNADNLGTAFDGRNATAALDFNAPNTPHTATYDDTVLSKSFDELAATLKCDLAQSSLNLLADAKATHTENETQAQNIKEAAELAIIITIMQTALGVANTAMAVYNLVLAAALVGVASGSLASAVATCVASLGTACGLVAVAVAGLVAAIAAVIAAGVALAANIAALVVQTIAIVKTIEVANEAGSAISPPNPNEVTDPNTGESTSNSDLAAQARETAESLKREAAEKVIKARDSINNSTSTAVTVRDRFNLIKTQTQALANTNAAVGDPLFSTYTTSANNQVQTNINQANTAITQLTSAQPNGNNAVAALGTAQVTPDPSNPLGPPLVSYPNADYQAASDHLSLAEPKAEAASTSFTNLQNSYLNGRNNAINARNRVIAIRNALPPLPVNATQAQINARNAYLAVLADAETKANNVISTYDQVINIPFDLRNALEVWIGTGIGKINEALGNITDAKETIVGALDAEASATEMENNVGGDNPDPTTSVLTLSSGLDAILQAADAKGVEK